MIALRTIEARSGEGTSRERAADQDVFVKECKGEDRAMSAVTTARKLASIQRIKALDPIPAADAIERATILGWQLVVKRGEFAVGDLCVYCEIDALLPARPAFEFLRPRKFIVRTVRLRGQISQGICFPLAILPPGTPIAEGADVTAALGVVKYEPPLPAHFAGQAKGPLPRFIPKTDETRVQVLEEVLARHRGTTFATTEKLDGTSMTCYLRDGVFGVCSRSLDLVESAENLFWQAARRYGVEEKLRALGGNVAVQGELVGEGIQKNRLGLRGVQFFLFSIFDIDRYAFRDVAAFVTTARALDLPTVPLVDASFALADDLGVPELGRVLSCGTVGVLSGGGGERGGDDAAVRLAG